MALKLRHIAAAFLAFIATYSFAQAPHISYSGPQVYTAGTAISPLTPGNTGGAVPLPTPVTIASGLNNVTGVAVDGLGNVYVAENGNQDVKEIPVGGGPIITLASGLTATGIAVDAAGNVYIVDNGENIIRKLPAGGGNPVLIGSGFSGPYGIAIDAAGNLYIGDANNNAVKKIPAGSNTPVSIGTGFNHPTGVAVDAAGNVYVADRGDNAIKKILANGGSTITLANGSGNPNGVAVDAAGNVYFADTNNNSISEILVSGGTTTVGSGFFTPAALAIDGGNIIYVANTGAGTIQKMSAGGYTINQQLPAGLIFNNGTGVISGTPTAASPSTNYNITATNSSGNSTTTLNITINLPAKPHISYSSPQVYTMNMQISPISPVNTGGAIPATGAYAINPALPQGLNFDINAGTISGTPTAASAATNYTVTATNLGGNGTAIINITVNLPPKPAISYASPQSFTTFTAISPVTPVNTGGAVFSSGAYSINPSLPAGLTLDVNAGTISGTPTVVSPATNYTVTASNAGGSGTAIINITVKPYPVPSLSYHTPNAYPVNVAINPLAPTSSGVGPGGSTSTVTLASGLNNLTGVAVDAAGNVYAVENGSGDVKKIPASGASPFVLASGFNQPTGVAVDAAGNVYIVESGASILWKIPAGGGSKIAVGSGFSGPYGVAVDAAGNVYIGDANNNAVKKIPAGSNTPVTIGSGFNHPTGVAVDAAGNVYVADRGSNTIKEILVNGSTISLGSGSGNPNGVAVDAAGDVYYADTNSNTIVEIPAGGGARISVGSGLFLPTAVAVVGSNIIYVADNGAATIEKITITGGYTISPALPAGLSFDTNTGIISGTPTAVSAATNYTVRAYNVGGSTSAIVNIAVFSQGAALANLAISSGTLAPAFAAATTVYTANVPYATSSITVTPTAADPNAAVTVNGTAVAQGSASGSIALNQGANIITTVVTAADGMTTKTYTIKVTRGAPSTNALIASISLSPVSTLVGTTGPGYLNFTTTVGGSESSVQVIPTTKDATATITVNGIAATSGTPSQPIALNAGANTITTVITAQDGVTTKTIIITVNKAPSTNAGLANIALSSGTLTPAFATATNSYTASVSSATASITLTPTASDATAAIMVNGTAVTSGSASASIPLTTGPNTITTVVTAQDGKTVKTYTVVVTRLSNNAALANLALSSGTLAPVFAGTTTSYTASVPFATTSITVTPTTADATATVMVNGTAVASGTASGAISLNQGANTITTIVTAQDGTTTKTYTVKITRAAPSTNALIASISLNPVSTLVGSTGPGYLNFTTAVGGGVSSVQVIATAKDATATITVNGIAATSGVASQPINLVPGANTITTVITAQDGVTTKTIIITVNKAPSTNAGLANITLSSGTLAPVFATATTSYTATVGNAAASITVTPATSDGSATVNINGVAVPNGSASPNIPLAVGSNTITLVVTAQDGKATKTYTVVVTRAPSSNASLANLVISSGKLAPVFASTTTGYTASVSNTTTSITVTPTTADATASVSVNGATVAPGAASAAIPLTVGANTITTLVTAQDGATTLTYTVTVTRAPSTDALLTSVKLTPAATLKVVTGPSYVNYTTSVPNTTSSVTITATEQDLTATIAVNGMVTASGTASAPVALAVGSNTINIVSTAQDGVTTKTYTITATRAAAPGMNNPDETLSVTKPTEQVTLEDGITVHQGVSPNGDGINDYLTIDGIANHPDNNLKIIDRNGIMVYQAKGYDNTSKIFDGHSSLNGKMQLPGTYFYSLDYIVKGENVHKTGYLLLKY